LRISGGTIAGRKLLGPKSGSRSVIRPTSDRVRQALFNILADRVLDACVLDLYAGSGALGLEALSRGADRVFFVDQAPDSLNLIKKNLLLCFKQPRATIHRGALNRASTYTKLDTLIDEQNRFNLVFLDPPYQKQLAVATLTFLEKSALLAPDARIIVEENSAERLPAQHGRLRLLKERKYGETGIWIYALT